MGVKPYFFKPEDFDDIPINDTWDTYIVADRANAKLEREGKIVYGNFKNDPRWEINFSDCQSNTDTHKAILINIEPIEKCEHPKEKVRFEGAPALGYKCECGARVEPSVFVSLGITDRFKS